MPQPEVLKKFSFRIEKTKKGPNGSRRSVLLKLSSAIRDRRRGSPSRSCRSGRRPRHRYRRHPEILRRDRLPQIILAWTRLDDHLRIEHALEIGVELLDFFWLHSVISVSGLDWPLLAQEMQRCKGKVAVCSWLSPLGSRRLFLSLFPTGAQISAPITWSILRDGSEQPASPTTLAGTPATVFLGGTAFKTTEPAATREQ